MAQTQPDIRKRLGEAIRQFRLAAGLSPKEFGDDIGKNQYYVLQLEDGQVDVDILTVEKCAEVFGIEIGELFLPGCEVVVLLDESGDGNGVNAGR